MWLGLTRYQLLTTFGLYFGHYGIFTANHIFTVFGFLEPVLNCGLNSTTQLNDSALETCLLCNQNNSISLNSEKCTPCAILPRDGYRSAYPDLGLACAGKFGAYIQHLVSSLQMAGLLVGSFVCGQISDRYGRRPTAIAGVFGLLITSTSSLFSPTYHVLCALRFLCGCCIGCMLVALINWTLEEVEPGQRMFVKSVANGWGPGRILMVIGAYLTRNWRWTFLFCNAFAIPVLVVLLFFTTESTRWLSQKGSLAAFDKAEKRISAFNGHKAGSGRVYVGKIDKGSKWSYRDLFSTKQLTIRTLIMSYIWFTCSFVSYGMDLTSGKLPGDIYVNQLILAVGLAVARPLAFFLDRNCRWFTRRTLYFMTITFPILQLIALAALCTYEGQSQAIDTTLIVLSITGIVILEYQWVAIGLYSSELFPTICRSSGYAFAALFGRLGNILAPQASFLAETWKPAPYIIFAAVGVTAVVVSWFFLPETKGIELPDNLKLESTSTRRENRNDIPFDEIRDEV